MTTWTSLFPDEAILLGRVWFKQMGQFNVTVPTSLTLGVPGFLRAAAVGCGGDGDHWGGTGAYARSVVPVTPGEALKIQVGRVATGAVSGDSWVKRNDGTVICYADRGRGNGTKGQASLSIGDVTYDGQDGNQTTGRGGAASYDANDYAPLIGAVRGADYALTWPSDYGGGGHVNNFYDAFGNLIAVADWNPGAGEVCLEWFDSNPHY